MKTLLFILIGIIASLTLRSADVTEDMWEHWVIIACLCASILVAYFVP